MRFLAFTQTLLFYLRSFTASPPAELTRKLSLSCPSQSSANSSARDSPKGGRRFWKFFTGPRSRAPCSSAASCAVDAHTFGGCVEILDLENGRLADSGGRDNFAFAEARVGFPASDLGGGRGQQLDLMETVASHLVL